MAHSVSLVAVVLVFLAYEGLLVESVSRCPKSPVEAESSAKSCLKRIGLDVDASAGGGMSNDVNRLKEYCRDGTLDGALDCVDEILTACKKESQEMSENLSKAINIDKLRSGFKYICENVEVLEDNQQCIAQNQEPIQFCVRAETEKFQRRMRVQKETGSMDPDSIWEMSCGFMDKLFACQHDVYSENCSKKLAEVMEMFLQSAKPPICEQYSGSSPVTASWTLLSVLLSLYLYLRD